MTAAHCLCNVIREDGMCLLFKGVEYFPMYPFSGKSYKATHIVVPEDYINAKILGRISIPFDYGFIIFDCNDNLPGQSLELDFNSKQEGVGISIGYPDKWQYGGTRMMKTEGVYENPSNILENYYVMQSNDMPSGSSGGPIIDKNSGKVVSLNSNNYEEFYKEQMSGPVFNTSVKEAIDKLQVEIFQSFSV